MQKKKTKNKCCSMPSIDKLLSPVFFKALGDPNRIIILAELSRCSEKANVGKIAECCPIDISVVSRHLAILKNAGILASEKRGKEVFYWVKFATLANLLRKMADAIEACCPTDNPFE